MTNNICYLSRFDLFQDMSDSEIKDQSARMHSKEIKKGEILYSPHQESQNIYVLEHGEIMLYHSHEGRRESWAPPLFFW